jgi:O-acetyl-ADP-ribose deacetylase (regulator of RNase III)
MTIIYQQGDVTQPANIGNNIIVHICNDIGGWGKGFVMALSAKWETPETNYRQWYKTGQNFALGDVQFVQVEETIWVANLIDQRDIRKDEKGNPPIRYDAVSDGLKKIAVFALLQKASVHMPRIGCGLAGGKWELMEPIIIEQLIEKGIQVTVYDL